MLYDFLSQLFIPCVKKNSILGQSKACMPPFAVWVSSQSQLEVIYCFLPELIVKLHLSPAFLPVYLRMQITTGWGRKILLEPSHFLQISFALCLLTQKVMHPGQVCLVHQKAWSSPLHVMSFAHHLSLSP